MAVISSSLANFHFFDERQNNICIVLGEVVRVEMWNSESRQIVGKFPSKPVESFPVSPVLTRILF
jgi:hypothetical protein